MRTSFARFVRRVPSVVRVSPSFVALAACSAALLGLAAFAGCSSSGSSGGGVYDDLDCGCEFPPGFYDARPEAEASGPIIVCPDAAPEAGTACSDVPVVCEYGQAEDPACDTLMVCLSSAWTPAKPYVACVTGTCPSTMGEAADAGSCAPVGLQCAYPQGECVCAPPLQGDGGGPYAWYCQAGAPGCSAQRPRLGSPCSAPGDSCPYGSCPAAVTVACDNGVWQATSVGCQADGGP